MNACEENVEVSFGRINCALRQRLLLMLRILDIKKSFSAFYKHEHNEALDKKCYAKFWITPCETRNNIAP